MTEGVPMGLGDNFEVPTHVERNLLSYNVIPSDYTFNLKPAFMLLSISHEVLSPTAKQAVYPRPEHIVDTRATKLFIITKRSHLIYTVPYKRTQCGVIVTHLHQSHRKANAAQTSPSITSHHLPKQALVPWSQLLSFLRSQNARSMSIRQSLCQKGR
jgi:hypothetical protein